MNKLRFTINTMAAMLFALTCASVVQAQPFRTFVSSTGEDFNPCTRASPCKTLSGAYSKTAVDGEIDVLDTIPSAPLTISKSITIDATGTFASIQTGGLAGITINIPESPGDPLRVVRIRGLSINGAASCGMSCGVSTGMNGINIGGSGANAVYVEDTVIDGFTQNGINVVNSATAVSGLHLRNVTIRNCANAGVNINPTSTNAVVLAFDNVNITRCASGIDVGNGGRGSITRSFFGNGATGVGIKAAATSSVTDFSVSETTFTGLSTGIFAGVGSHVRIAKCVIAGNVTSLGFATGGRIDTGLNNTIFGNGTNTAPNGSPFTQQ